MCRVLVMGYDRRSKCLYNRLNKVCEETVDFFEPINFDFDKIKNNDYKIIILPIPTKTLKDDVLAGYNISLSRILYNWQNAKYVYAAVKKNPLFSQVNGLSLLDDEIFVLKNAYLTAKAVVEIVLEDVKMYPSTAMVVGNGRIGKYICKMLKNKDVDIVLVTGSYKNICPDEYKKCIGYDKIANYINDCQIVLNTAPYNYFEYDELDAYAGKYLELASKPYGFEYCSGRLPKSVIMCPSLPGKYYPEEAAEIIYDSVFNYVCKGVIL